MRCKKVHIIALSSLGHGLSGGDRIYIELARRWSQKIPVVVYVWEEGLAMCQREGLKGKNLEIKLIQVGQLYKLGFLFTYSYRIWLGIWLGLTIKLSHGDLVFSASEFWMDSLPAVITKLRFNSGIKWVAAWFQTAPNPFHGFAEGSRDKVYRWSAFMYWFMQKPIQPLVSRIADFVLVNNESEKNRYPRLNKMHKVIVLLGAVDIKLINNYIKSTSKTKGDKYLGVFQGRFHPQKGVVELIEIWKAVTKKIPSSKLAMIGDGPLMEAVRSKISDLGLNKNVDLLGFQSDGDIKYSTFQNSKVVLHPAFYDSGGMASAEAMAFGLPCIGFDLDSYKSYYPKGMIKVPINDIQSFADEIVALSSDEKRRYSIGKEAREMIIEHYSWDNRASEILSAISS